MSSNCVISGCIGAIDGLLVVVKCPSMKDSDNYVGYSKVAHIRGFFSSYLRFFCPQYSGSF